MSQTGDWMRKNQKHWNQLKLSAAQMQRNWFWNETSFVKFQFEFANWIWLLAKQPITGTCRVRCKSKSTLPNWFDMIAVVALCEKITISIADGQKKYSRTNALATNRIRTRLYCITVFLISNKRKTNKNVSYFPSWNHKWKRNGKKENKLKHI